MNRTVLITGCSTGIGRAAAEMFQRAGWNVAATMRQPDQGAVLSLLERTIVLALDVRDSLSIASAYKATLERFGHIDVLVNNAGFGLFGFFEEATDSALREQVDTNLLGPILTIRAILPHFRARRSGLVINVSSIAGFVGPPLNSYYAATKWGLEGLTESLAAELSIYGIKCKLVEPGLTRTAFHANYSRQEPSLIADYNGVRESLSRAILPNVGSAGASSESAAAVILEAANDVSPRMRYPAGADAQAIFAMRDKMDSEAFVASMRKRFST